MINFISVTGIAYIYSKVCCCGEKHGQSGKSTASHVSGGLASFKLKERSAEVKWQLSVGTQIDLRCSMERVTEVVRNTDARSNRSHKGLWRTMVGTGAWSVLSNCYTL